MARYRKMLQFQLQFDWPATEVEAAAVAEKHLFGTGVYTHEIQVHSPGIERVAGKGEVYTWQYSVDAEFESLGDEPASSVVTLGPTGLVDVNGNPIGGGK